MLRFFSQRGYAIGLQKFIKIFVRNLVKSQNNIKKYEKSKLKQKEKKCDPSKTNFLLIGLHLTVSDIHQ